MVDREYLNEILSALTGDYTNVNALKRRVGGTEASMFEALSALETERLIEVNRERVGLRWRVRLLPDVDKPGSGWGGAYAAKAAYHRYVAEALDELIDDDAGRGIAPPEQSRTASAPESVTGTAAGLGDDGESVEEVPDEPYGSWLLDDGVESRVSHGDDDGELDGSATSGGSEALLATYLAEIQRIPLLSLHAEADLARRVKRGVAARQRLRRISASDGSIEARTLEVIASDGEFAKTEMILANLRLVVAVAKRYRASGMARLDLIQEGNLGLMRAVDGFDYSLGFKFSTYATWWIRQAVSRAIFDKARMIRIPVHMMETIRRLEKARSAFIEKHEREPSPEDLAEGLGADWTSDRVLAIKALTREALSLEELTADRGIGCDEILTAEAEVQSPDVVYDETELRLKARELLATLSEREDFILRHRFGITEDERPRTLEEVGVLLDLTRERIRQIEKRAIGKVRMRARAFLGAYLDE